MNLRTTALSLVVVAFAAACGSTNDSDTAPPESGAATTVADAALPPVDSTPRPSSPPPSGDSQREPCGVDDSTSLTDAQFAFVGTVLAVDEEVHPWTTDPENPDRPDVAATMRWVTFEVEGWYTRDWGTTFPVWMRTISLEVGDRAAVGGDAYATEVGDFAGQSGEVNLCAPLTDAEASPTAWDEFFGAAVPPLDDSVVSDTIPPSVEPTKVFGDFEKPCAPTVLTNGPDDESNLAAGASCFVTEVDAGRPAVWDVLIATIEGDPIPIRYDFDGGFVTITTDYSFDDFGSGGVGEQTCAGVLMTDWLPDGVDCSAETNDGVGFVADSLPFGG